MSLTLGRVIQEQKNYYLVDIAKENPVRAVLKGVAKAKQKRIAVGDYVNVEIFDGIADNAIIRNVRERKNFLPKPLIANIDNVFFINCFIDPVLDLSYIDKFLFCAAVKNIHTTIVFNKIDILSAEQLENLQNIAQIYKKIGYDVLLTSKDDAKSIEQIKDVAKDKVSVFAGQSGVGKSSIMQILLPDEYFAVQELSRALLRGKNTTSHTSLLQLSNGGFVADTPGFSVFEMPEIKPQFVASYWNDFVETLRNAPCKYSNCSHRNEPNCKIISAVETGEIAESRYMNFIAIFEEMNKKKY
ncbi:MAG: ribosome small subunit-dependent GTPase A [Chitinivibrionia bacterium]|nr:ribosome small subunit-dependent GTPase A [Chitinivibrionia bacterium]